MFVITEKKVLIFNIPEYHRSVSVELEINIIEWKLLFTYWKTFFSETADKSFLNI